MKSKALFLCGWLALAASAQETSTRAVAGDLPQEVVIKGAQAQDNLILQKPPLHIDVDPYESIRPSLETEPSILLAVSPLSVSWRRTYPDFLSDSRVLEPWRTPIGQRLTVSLRVRDQLEKLLQRKLGKKEAKHYAWTLTIADEEGRVFQHYEDSGNPPEEKLWDGQNAQGEWIWAGRSYSAIYTFTEPGGPRRTSVGKPILFQEVIHQEATGLYISLDSSVLFGASKADEKLASLAGLDLLRSAADLIKRSFTGIPMSVRAFAGSRDLATSQGNAVADFLRHELMIASRQVNVDAAAASYSDQRVEIVILNR